MFRLAQWDVAGKRVFVRADLNDCLAQHGSTSLKFQRLLPTLHYFKDHGAQITLVTHLGRPTGQHVWQATHSTQPLVTYFKQAGFTCSWTTVHDMSDALHERSDILLLENMRVYPQEEAASVPFAKKISQRCEFFVEDGFGVLAREETSVIATAQLFRREQRSIGFSIQHELDHMHAMKEDPKQPYMVMVGGGKGHEKLETLYAFFKIATHIALCPGLSELPETKAFIDTARHAGITILLPHDYILHEGGKISIGPITLRAWQPTIMMMKSIVYNGMMGMRDYPETTLYTRKLFELFIECDAQIIVAGGDTADAARAWHVSGPKLFLSTGGGSTLAYLSRQELPGLTVVDQD